jgi:choline dehydrogenase-like flavoprotein
MDAQVCIVGAGAAGGVVAFELGRRGIKVVVLESGPRHDFNQRWQYVRRHLRREDPWQSRLEGQDRHSVGGKVPYGLTGRRVRGVGGSTLHWEGYALRFHAHDFQLRSRYGIADDWPIGYADLEPYYARAEAGLGVAGSPDDPWASSRSSQFPLPAFPFSHSDGLFARACSTLGIGFHHLPQARNSVAYGGRAQCQACAVCAVCPTGAKASTDLTHARAAEATGNVRILTGANVLRLELDRSGGIGTAVYAHPDRIERRLTARIFVLAAGAVENVRLLLLSRSAGFPAGLANRSGLVGRRFMSHPSVDVIGRARENVYPYRIGFSTAMSRQFSVERDRTKHGAFLIEFLNSAGLTPGDLAVTSGLTGEALRRHVQGEFGRRLGVRIYCEQLPDSSNSITLSGRVKDYFGNPGPHITYDVGRYERDSLEEAKGIGGRILLEMGATDIRSSALSAASHQIGTHRMGTDPRTSVVDPNLRTHDVPNLYLVGSGAFVTATPSPPTLTIVALAIRAAEHVAAQVRSVERSGEGGEGGLHARQLIERPQRLEDRERAG